MKITIDIPDEKDAEFLTAFLARHPKPAGSAETDRQWVKTAVRDLVRAEFRAGKKRLLELQLLAANDDSIIS
jgi:hypothetical protein